MRGADVGPAVLSAIPFTELFIPSYSTDEARVVGWGYYVYYGGVLTAYAVLLRSALRGLKQLTGGPRLELQIWLCGMELSRRMWRL